MTENHTDTDGRIATMRQNNTLPRRSFLRKGAAVAGGAIVVGATPASANHRPSVTTPRIGAPAGDYELSGVMQDGKKSHGWMIRYDVPKEMDLTIRLQAGPLWAGPQDVFRRKIPEGEGTMTMWSDETGDELVVTKGQGEPLFYL